MLSTKEKIINNFLYFMSGELAAKFLGFLAIIFIARKLGVSDFGKLGFAEAFFSYFIYIGIAGIDTIATRDVARDKRYINTYLGNILSLKLMLSLFTYFLLNIIIFSLNIDSQLKYLTILYGLCLFPIALSTEWLFQGIEKMRYIGLFRVLREATYAIGIVLILTYTANIYFVPILRVIAMLAAVFLLFMLVHKAGFKFGFAMDIDLWKNLLKQSLPILTTQVLIIVVYTFSIILLGLLGKTEEVGYFIAIQKIVLFFFGLAGVFWAVIFPTLSRLYFESKEQLRMFDEKVSKVIGVVVIPIGFLGFTLADPIVTFLYGSGYVKSIEIFQVLIWVAVFGMLNGIFVMGLLASDNQILYLKTVGLQAVLMGIFAVILVPEKGAIGASISWFLVEVVGLFLCKRYYNQVVNFNFYRYLIKPLFASAIMVAIALKYLDVLNIVVTIISSIIIYFFIMLIIKGIDIKELKLVYQSVRPD
ncbi:flippase [bacterium]|nr:flippase [bacterium]